MEYNSTKKRARVDSGTESNSDATEFKRNRTESDIRSDEFRVDSAACEFETSSGSGDVQNDILNILDDSEAVTDEIQDLDSVIRSFEEEILRSPLPAPDTTAWTGEYQPDLGYLLEASDDELGLPPTKSPAVNNQRNEDLLPSNDSFELPTFGFGFGEEYGVANEFMAVGGLFEYPEASDFSEFLWRPESESLPAV